MAEGRGTDPATLGDAALLRLIRAAVGPRFTTELRRRHLHGLTTVAAGYLREQDRIGGDAVRTDPESVVDAVLARARTLPEPNVDGETFLLLCARVRARILGRRDPGSPPTGLVDLLDPAGPEDPVVAATLVRAYGSLDERDRVPLWFLAADGGLPAQLAQTLSLGSGDLAATLTHRARTHLRQAYLKRRLTDAPPPPGCAAIAPRLVTTTEDPDVDEAAHVAGCPYCQDLVATLDALPALLASAIASVAHRATPTDVNPAGIAAAPVLISTTPEVGPPTGARTAAPAVPAPTVTVADTDVAGPATRAVAVGDRVGGSPGGDDGNGADEVGDAAGDEDGTGRRTGAIVGILAVFVAVAIAAGVWILVDRTTESPGDTGIVDTPSSMPATTGVPTTRAPRTTTAPSTTSSTTSTVGPTTTGTPVTPAPTPAPPAAPAPRPGQPATTPWVPPATDPPVTNPPVTDPPATTPAPTAPPTTAAPVDPDPGGTDP